MATSVQRHLYRIINSYPPYLGAGIRFLRHESDTHTLRVDVVADDGGVVARVTKRLWVKRKGAEGSSAVPGTPPDEPAS